MKLKKDLVQLLTFSKLDLAAIACAVILSLACLARGAVDDGVVALLLLFSLPPLWLAFNHARPVHAGLKSISIVAFAFLLLILCLQQLTGGDGQVWQEVNAITGQAARITALHDKSAWMQDIGRLLFIVIIFTIALFVGASESSSRIFLQTLLLSGTVFLSLTFFAIPDDAITTTVRQFYRHGFVNPNNAAAYLGVMWLLALAQAVRFFKFPSHPTPRMFIDLIDQLSMSMIIKGGFLLFAILLTLAGLLMTGSRGGILVSLFCGGFFCLMVILKINLRSTIRKLVIFLGLAVIGTLMFWCFTNFGQAITSKLTTDGVSSNSRLDIYRAVLPMIGDHPLLGAGLGSFPAMFQRYRPNTVSADGIIDKAHNSYLEFAAEMGIPAFIVLMVALGWAGLTLYRGIRERKERYVVPSFGLSVWLLAALYSLVDFPLQIPGLTALFIAIIAVCISQSDPRFSEPAQTAPTFVRRRRVRVRNSQSAPGRHRTRVAG